ncbi:uncharacterized protein MEPE_00953 [Melanopsichium pennsylvanicum]|uniref:YTH domain-containing protein n=2 Tax=Melanopsichium pennsylvanicum TaxID=63383 RepID=A0AAJ5C361_9BASI|nr:signal transduction protein involved in rna splicing [Melanopsichium pennsylvanicum 4]SNX82247.1 uncharacterized protein MEPE_00953 [Melanopsichium pennsylvanicum]
MTHNPANSQRPSRANPARKQTLVDADRRNANPASTASLSDRASHQSARHSTSPPPTQFTHFSPNHQNIPPGMNALSHPPLGQQVGAPYPSYGGPVPVDGYGYIGPPFHLGRPNSESYHYARPPSRAKPQSSGSGSTLSPHDAGSGSHLQPHFSPSFPTVSSNPSVAHSGGRTRWAWVPIEVAQTHLSEDGHLQYAPYPVGYYYSPFASATLSASSSPQSYQQPYGGEGSVPRATPYGAQASPNYTQSHPYLYHPGHNSHPHVMGPGRGSWSGSPQPPLQTSGGGARDSSSSGGGSRRQSNQSGQSGNAQRRTSSNSSGNHSSPRRGCATLPHRPAAASPGAQSNTPESGNLPPQALELVGEETPEGAIDIGVSAPASDVDGNTDEGDVTAAERIPGSGLRPHYHPQQGPRSDFVLWCGNVPQDATVEELWEVFPRLTPDEYRRWLATAENNKPVDELANPDIDGHGVLSIFIISRSNCAFINYASSAHLDRAVKYFHGRQVRSRDPRCPKLVCRIRKKDDEAQAGVAGQRGRGIHVAWLKQQRELERAQAAANDAALDPPTRLSAEPLSPPQKDSIPVAAGLASAGSYSSSGSASYTSTNSSLFRHPAFRHRFFILKSLRSDDLDRSIETGYWATQPHNENVLDQAFRNSETVYLIFGVNQTGQFYGYAKMAGPIFTPTSDAKNKDEQRRRGSLSSVLSGVSSSMLPATIHESADENASEADPNLSGIRSSSGLSSRRSHPTLDKHDIEGARGLIGTMSIDGVGEASRILPMTSPLPLSPTMEEAGYTENNMSPQRNDTITPRAVGSFAQSSTWPYTSSKASASEADLGRPKLASRVSEQSTVGRITAEPDEYGVRRLDMQMDTPQSVSSPSGQPSLAPSDSASWSSADPRRAEQIALRAVIHNLRLDELESRGKADMLESQLRSSSNDTDATVTAKGSGSGAGESDEQTPPRQSSSDSWGKPFRVEWIRTDPIPFQRVKKLRNPWRDNRQVKVSRDGTELEPGIGRQLLEEWNRLHPTSPVDSTQASKHVKASSEPSRTASDEDE